MKYLTRIALAALSVFLLAPAFVGALDIIWWFWTDANFSTVDWNTNRAGIAFLMIFPAIFTAIGCTLE